MQAPSLLSPGLTGIPVIFFFLAERPQLILLFSFLTVIKKAKTVVLRWNGPLKYDV